MYQITGFHVAATSRRIIYHITSLVGISNIVMTNINILCNVARDYFIDIF